MRLLAEQFINAIVSCGAFPLVTKRNRVADNSATIIDHITTNVSHQKIFPKVFDTYLMSNHYILYCQVTNTSRVQINKSKMPSYFYRDKSKFDLETYATELDNKSNSFLTKLPTPKQDSFNFKEIFNRFTKTVSSLIDKHAPIKKFSRRQRKLKFKPWISKGILVSIKNKHNMFKSHFIRGSLIWKEKLTGILKILQ